MREGDIGRYFSKKTKKIDMITFNDFTNLYPLSKTLRFELKPIGATVENIKRDGILAEDGHRAESYLRMKKIIDCYHKRFIDDSLASFALDDDLLRRYEELYKKAKKDEKETAEFGKIQASMRKQIAKRLTGSEAYKRIFKKELIQEDLAPFLEMDDNGTEGDLADNLDLVEEFRNFTTYFTGFYQNRENMYSDEEKSTAIAYRLINENLPKFIDNIAVFERIVYVPELGERMKQVYADCEKYLGVSSINDIFRLDYYSTVLTQKQIAVYII